jgi:hypothetical protein
VTGERLSQAGWLNPSKSVSQESETGGRIHQFLWQRSHAVSDAIQELSGEERVETVPSRVK